jgi:DNA-binding MarR family transcriptional regulator
VFGSLAHNRSSWMLLLVLSEAFQVGQEITIKGAAYQAGLPLSSALRRLNEMCSEGLILRRGDPGDARRSFVSLTPSGQSYFLRYEAELSRAEEIRKPS